MARQTKKTAVEQSERDGQPHAEAGADGMTSDAGADDETPNDEMPETMVPTPAMTGCGDGCCAAGCPGKIGKAVDRVIRSARRRRDEEATATTVSGDLRFEARWVNGHLAVEMHHSYAITDEAHQAFASAIGPDAHIYNGPPRRVSTAKFNR